MPDAPSHIVLVGGPRPDDSGPGRAIRAFVGGSLLAAAGGLAILLVGAPIALVVRIFHDLIALVAGR